MGRFLNPDNYIQNPYNTQNLNRYGYCVNNPLIYTDPSGDFIFTLLAIVTGQWWALPMAIGADVGMWQGGSMANGTMNPFKWNYTSGKTWGYMGIGALIGGAAGGAAMGVSAAGAPAWFAGSIAGSVSGGGFNGLATNWNPHAMLMGAAFGAASSAIGGVFASAIGGGWGAFAGGVASNITNQLFNTGGNLGKVNWGGALLSGAMSVGMYHSMSYINYKLNGGRNIGGYKLSYKQYTKINSAYQRSSFWHKEYGVYLNYKNQSARFVPANDRHKYDVTFDDWKVGDNATVHIHWDIDGINLGNDVYTVGGYHSPADLQNLPGWSLVIGRTTSTYSLQGTGAYNYIKPDPFIRFFMFLWQ